MRMSVAMSRRSSPSCVTYSAAMPLPSTTPGMMTLLPCKPVQTVPNPKAASRADLRVSMHHRGSRRPSQAAAILRTARTLPCPHDHSLRAPHRHVRAGVIVESGHGYCLAVLGSLLFRQETVSNLGGQLGRWLRPPTGRSAGKAGCPGSRRLTGFVLPPGLRRSLCAIVPQR